MPNNYVLVTGGAGYIGSSTCQALSAKGLTPVVFDNLSTGHREFVKWGPLVIGDLQDKDLIDKVFKEFQIRNVMHFASKAYVGESVQNPLKYYRENIGGAVNLLESFVLNNGKNLIFSSSCATYGDPLSEIINEHHLQTPVNPYGMTKLVIEKLIFDVKKVHNFNFGILRYFNAAGALQNSGLAERHNPETHVIPLMVRAAKEGQTFYINGSDFNTSDGTTVRDYIHVADLADAHIQTLDYIDKSNLDLVCNVGSGKGISTLQLAKKMKELYPSFKFAFGERRLGDPSQLIADNSLSKEILGISYNNSDIDFILESTLRQITN